MKRFVTISFLSLLLGLCMTPMRAEQASEQLKRHTYISVTPLSYIYGGNIGVEREMARKLSLFSELTVHGWGETPDNAMLSTSLIWYMTGNTSGLYLRPKVFVGAYWREFIDKQPYYAGAAVSLGASMRVNKRMKIWTEAGVQFPTFFGKGDKKTIYHGDAMLYGILVGPGAVLKFDLGLSFRI